MKGMRRAVVAAVVVLGAGAVACDAHSTDATGFIFQYALSALPCDTTCATPDSTSSVAAATHGDTVWVRHAMTLVAAIDSFMPQIATLRPGCAGPVAVVSGNTTVRSVPTPTCTDSTVPDTFQLAGVNFPQTVVVYTRWVVDTGLSPGGYLIRGRVMVHPAIEPVVFFTINP